MIASDRELTIAGAQFLRREFRSDRPLAVDVEQHGSRGVGGVGRMHLAPAQVPEQETVYGAEGEFAAFRARPRARRVIENPGKFGCPSRSKPVRPQRFGSFPPQPRALRDPSGSRSWMDAVLAGRTASFDETLLPKASPSAMSAASCRSRFFSPKIIQALADSTAPAGLTVSSLTQALPHAWTAQEQMLAL